MMRWVLVLLIGLRPFVALADEPQPEPPSPEPGPAPDPVPPPDLDADTPLTPLPWELPPALLIPEPPPPPLPEPPPPPLPEPPLTPQLAANTWRLVLSDLTAFRLDPSGLETRARLGMQKSLDAPDTFVFAGVYPTLDQVSAQLAAGFEIQPVSVFRLSVGAEVQRYFGVLGSLQSFTTPTSNYSDQRVSDLRDSAGSPVQRATVFHIAVHPLVQKRFGDVLVRSLLQLDYWVLGVRDLDTVAYEPTLDTLLPDRGWTLATDTDVLYVSQVPGLVVGLRHSLVHPFYGRRHFVSDTEFEIYDGENGHQRLGLLAAYTFPTVGRLTKPTAVVILSWYLSHRWRTGEHEDRLAVDVGPDDYTSRAIPYFLVGFSFESDLLAR